MFVVTISIIQKKNNILFLWTLGTQLMILLISIFNFYFLINTNINQFKENSWALCGKHK